MRLAEARSAPQAREARQAGLKLAIASTTTNSRRSTGTINTKHNSMVNQNCCTSACHRNSSG